MLDLAILLMMAWNAIVSAWWAVGAFGIARRERLWRWPVPWRWLVFGWMATKSALFIALEISLRWHIPLWVAVAIVVEFTICHTWAWWRWRHLPDLADSREGLGVR